MGFDHVRKGKAASFEHKNAEFKQHAFSSLNLINI